MQVIENGGIKLDADHAWPGGECGFALLCLQASW
jgi:hypothetical protein